MFDEGVKNMGSERISGVEAHRSVTKNDRQYHVLAEAFDGQDSGTD
ncbi:MAG: hypothetical protein WBR56_20270 [Sedimenticolaceae bacterium]